MALGHSMAGGDGPTVGSRWSLPQAVELCGFQSHRALKNARQWAAESWWPLGQRELAEP